MIIEIASTARRWRLGDNVDTDILYPGRFMTLASESPRAALEGLKALHPAIAEQFTPGDIIVAGRNFGCGSSREYAATALRDLQVPIVVATSFSRIFYRNAFNVGLPVLECPDVNSLPDSGGITIDLATGVIETSAGELRCPTVPGFLIELLEGGGLLERLKTRLEVGPHV
ncbi:LeuD/DmdB family oxidoreductase small subunit [Nocardia sp. CDC160]|uniref:LeuD/DmdB family oxidoreductase small subunit n=1 Tax=Nocardia sp. CDC160 TaxID=3112166 RepID=UPI002DBC9F54|nr:3-isopropylmalate dehydratase [Nocardia sp. CDC160]MEC3919182.1 3-isopropylmalate dehydratase [Nocardia sp. CDC160]